MPNVDPIVRFWIGVGVTLAIGISSGTVHLTGAIPHDWILPATSWCSILAFVGSSVLTGLNGLAATTQSRLASAAAIPEVKTIVTTNAQMADAAGPKVVSS